ncbi:twin-arginine translocase TatA/TatE family subunit [Caulobacter zeae]|jgi:sec-independent protein translocase protein TatA|uniref:Sec-independent protein translocase protein TatA n=4 Tax=Caulobacter TaxID=75 RepID=A0A2T9JFM7_9CAUL|nr:MULTISPECIES: twin-arginine translocase TatA/TatE family subunit [Caulobacter]KSB88559.1 preprotein translocase subunit TatA [Caulobacter vibrioides]MDG2529752.1 twin-arginine translocase TatA/TatE family subunit [Caulobacter endophyticus]NGM52066.1 twin-arginine translocase TatA/TatE family subunit [Caulobacter sp. 602-2]PLR28352.1 twin-arginine translocase TatA/TatE family subunit [Caulobacter zeae]PVM82487.1 twin-arginine translocase TatA/TatE family subunit [Caulobacter radicis]
MGSMSWIHWVIVIAVVALLFGGRGKLSGIMGDAAKGIKAFKDGLKDDSSQEVADNKSTGALPRTEAEKEDLRKS